MALMNRILNGLIFVLAVTALVFGFMLYQKRDQLRTHSDSLAKGLENVAGQLAPEDLARDMKYEDGAGKLGFENAAGISDLSGKLAARARAVNAQRDRLAQTATTLTNDLNLTEEAVGEDDLRALATYEEAATAIEQGIDVARTRNAALGTRLAELGKELGINVAASDFGSTNPEVYGGALNKLADAVAQLNDRNEEYLAALELVLNRLGESANLGVQIGQFKNPATMQQAVVQLGNSLERVSNDLKEYEKTADRIAVLEAQTKDLDEKLTVARENFDRVDTTLHLKEAEIEDLRGQLARKPGPEDPTTIRRPGSEVLEGKIVDVNYDWGYVVINLGEEDAMIENLTMTVGRDREFIGNVLVTKVYDRYAVAEIVPDMQQGMVLEGDNVYWLNQEAAGIGIPRTGAGGRAEPAPTTSPAIIPDVAPPVDRTAPPPVEHDGLLPGGVFDFGGFDN